MAVVPRLKLSEVVATKRFALVEFLEGASFLLAVGLDYADLVKYTAPEIHRADPEYELAIEDFASRFWVVTDAGVVIECAEEGSDTKSRVVVVPGFRRRFWHDVEKCETANTIEKHRFERSTGRKPRESKRRSYEHLPSSVRAHLLATARDFNRDAR